MSTRPDQTTPSRELVTALVTATAGGPAVPEALVRAADPKVVMETLLRERLLVTLGRPLWSRHGEALPAWFGDWVSRAEDATRRAGLLQHALLTRVVRACRDRDVAPMPLKGVVLAEALHGDLGARESADIDLLVRPAELDTAVDALEALGWREKRLSAPQNGLPRLHRVLEHETLPPIELHWRVHWYEDRFAGEVMDRASATPEGWLRPQPADDLAFLLLFLARDGFAGLRQVVDVAAWWRGRETGSEPGARVAEIAARHPALAPALNVSATVAERGAALAPGSLLAGRPAPTRGQRLALRLANPWLEGNREQIDAEVSLIDGLLAPPGQIGSFTLRRLVPPAHETLERSPELEHAPAARLMAARLGHAVRVVARYALALPRLVGSRRQA